MRGAVGHSLALWLEHSFALGLGRAEGERGPQERKRCQQEGGPPVVGPIEPADYRRLKGLLKHLLRSSYMGR